MLFDFSGGKGWVTGLRISNKSIFYGAFVLSISGGVIQILLFVYRIILSRLLGAEGMGVYQLLFPPIAVITALTLSGLTVAVSRLSAGYCALEDLYGLRRLVKGCELIFICFIIPAGLILVFGSKWISLNLLGDARIRMALLILPAYLLLLGIENIHKASFQGAHDMKPVAVSEISELVIRITVATGLLLWMRPKEPESAIAMIAAAMVVSEVFSAVFLTVLYRRRYHRPAGRCGVKREPGLYRNIAAIAVPISLAGLLNNFLNSANAVVLPVSLEISGMSESQAMREFGILSGMVMPLFMLPFSLIGSLSAVIVPKLSREKLLGNAADIRRKIGKSIHAVGLFTMPVISLMIPLCRELCRMIYGQEISGEIIWPLALGSLFTYYSSMAISILYGIGRQKIAAGIMVGSEILQFGFTYFLARQPRFGIGGYLAGFVVGSLLETVIAIAIAMRKTGLKGRWTNWVIVPLVSSALCGYAAFFLRAQLARLGLPDTAAVILTVGVACGIYYFLLRIQGVRPMKYLETLAESAKKEARALAAKS